MRSVEGCQFLTRGGLPHDDPSRPGSGWSHTQAREQVFAVRGEHQGTDLTLALQAWREPLLPCPNVPNDETTVRGYFRHRGQGLAVEGEDDMGRGTRIRRQLE